MKSLIVIGVGLFIELCLVALLGVIWHFTDFDYYSVTTLGSVNWDKGIGDILKVVLAIFVVMQMFGLAKLQVKFLLGHFDEPEVADKTPTTFKDMMDDVGKEVVEDIQEKLKAPKIANNLPTEKKPKQGTD